PTDAAQKNTVIRILTTLWYALSEVSTAVSQVNGAIPPPDLQKPAPRGTPTRGLSCHPCCSSQCFLHCSPAASGSSSGAAPSRRRGTAAATSRWLASTARPSSPIPSAGLTPTSPARRC